MAEPKQVIVMRKDLGMRKGKMIAQGAHASLKVFLNRSDQIWSAGETHLKTPLTPEMSVWLEGLYTKICVSVQSEQELLDIHEKALNAGIPCSLIQDAGLTEFQEATYTCCAIGPDDPEKINLITGYLPLL